MIQNIIFDMGGVIIRFDREYFIRRLGVQGEDELILMNEVFRSLEWARMDRGSISEQDAFQNICKRTPQRLHDAVEKLVYMWERPILPVDGMYELVAELKSKGYGIYLLSNASVRQHEYWPRFSSVRRQTDFRGCQSCKAPAGNLYAALRQVRPCSIGVRHDRRFAAKY
jgi:putative hydrolase of the HAD superfamily